MTDALQQQIEAIEAANANEASELEPGAGEQQQANDAPEPEEPEGDTNVNDEDEGIGGDLSDDDAPDDGEDDADGEEGLDEDEGGDDKPKRRSKPAAARIAELTAKLRQAERRAQELEEQSRTKPEEEAPPEAPAKPDPQSFEYGESDPKYIEALTDYKLAERDHRQALADADARKEQAARDRQEAQQQRLLASVQKLEAEGQAKYADFDTKLAEASAARGGEPLPPIVGVGIATSPVGGDVAYRLATDSGASDRIEAAAGRSAHAVALAIGEIEAEYMDSDDDGDLNPADPLDMARMNGRLRARMAGRKANQPVVTPTNAPEPPAKRARGGAGRAKVGPDTDDMQAFYRTYGKDLGR